jgi:hypothetical protein
MTDDVLHPRPIGCSHVIGLANGSNRIGSRDCFCSYLHHANNRSFRGRMIASLLMQAPLKKGGYSPKICCV